MLRSIRSFLDRMFRRPTGVTLQDKSRRLSEIYRRLDQATAAFKAASGLKCLTPCGQCCFSSTVEATELEMIPMAFDLIRRGTADGWYKRAEESKFEGRCVFYSSSDGYGKCCSYALRPLVCRLFGFAGNRDKYGRPRLVTCGLIKKEDPHAVELVLEKVAQGGLDVPMMSDLVMRVSSIDPAMSRESLPINTAFKKAVERISLNRKFAGESS